MDEEALFARKRLAAHSVPVTIPETGKKLIDLGTITIPLPEKMVQR